MRVVRLAASVILLSLVLLGCAREKKERVAAPDPPAGSKQDPSVLSGRWVEGPELARAVSAAASHPLAERAFRETGDPRLYFMPGLGVQAVGTIVGGGWIRVTILPYARMDDPTYATFLTLIEREGRTLVIRWDWIEGRLPTSLETGFEPVSLAGRPGWARQLEGYVLASGPAPGRAGERFQFIRFASCFERHGPGMCGAGAMIGGTIGAATGAGAMAGAAVGCGAGAAVAAVGCGYEATK